MEGYTGDTQGLPYVQDFEGCCILHWNFLEILWILDLVDCLSCDSTDLGSGKLFAVGSFGSWILYPGYVMGS